VGRYLCQFAFFFILVLFQVHAHSLTRTSVPFQIPFQNFVLTNSGEVASHQISMYREKVRSVGISLLGGNSGFAGPYELGIDSVRAVNEEDVTTPAVHP
jgi:Complex I intermediate-associated protein 30 (CIA30)